MWPHSYTTAVGQRPADTWYCKYRVCPSSLNLHSNEVVMWQLYVDILNLYSDPEIYLIYLQLLLCFECLEHVLLHTASLDSSVQSESGTGTGLSLGHKLVSAILRDHMRPIYSSLMTSCPMKLVAACLRLLTAMVLQGHQAARDVQQSFNFGYKPLVVFPNRTHRVKVCSEPT